MVKENSGNSLFSGQRKLNVKLTKESSLNRLKSQNISFSVNSNTFSLKIYLTVKCSVDRLMKSGRSYGSFDSHQK